MVYTQITYEKYTGFGKNLVFHVNIHFVSHSSFFTLNYEFLIEGENGDMEYNPVTIDVSYT